MGKISKNVVSGWKSTILGIGIIIASVVSVFYFPGIVNWWPQATAGIILGSLLMLSPDTLVKNAGKVLTKLTGVEDDSANKDCDKKDKNKEKPEPDEPIV